MRFELKIAGRYFRARRKSLARFTSFVAVTGIAAGVASLILANALARGFAGEMQDKILANTAHVSVFQTDGAEISDWKTIKAALENSKNVESVSATTYEGAVLVGAQKTNYAVLRVVQSSQFKVQSHIELPSSNLEPQNENRRPKTEDESIEISLGRELAEKTQLKIGDRAEIISIENESAPTTAKVHVKETFQTGLYEYDATWIYTSPESFARMKKLNVFTPTVLNISVRDVYAANETADEIQKNLGADFKAVDWQTANQPLFAALSLERKVALAIISLIIFIAALNITTTLALLVGERRLDIAVLRTCGATAKSLVFIFLFEGLFLGIAGIFFGVVFGLLGCFFGNYFRIINLSAEVYSLSYIPFRPSLQTILLIIFIAFLLCLAATAYPASRASKIKPLENLRQQ